MHAILGVLLVAAATVLFSWAFNQARRPVPRAWADSDLPVQLFVVVWIVALCGGIGLLANAFGALESEPLTPTGYAAIAAILVASGVLHYLLGRQRRGFTWEPDRVPADTAQAVPPPHAATGVPAMTQENDPHSRSPRAA